MAHKLAGLTLRAEKGRDSAAVDALTEAAFAPMPFSRGTEGPILRALRKSGDLTLSLVAEMSGEVVGHVAFSPVSIGDGSGQWFGLGPIAVLPHDQGRGIGGALVVAGLDRIAGKGASGCVLVGDPGYYGRFGFASHQGLTYQGLETSLVQYVAFSGGAPAGEITYAPAFDLEASSAQS